MLWPPGAYGRAEGVGMAKTASRRELLKGASALAVVAAVAPLGVKAAPARDARIERLIAAMSLEEKAGQLSIFSDPARVDGPPLNPGLTRQSLASLKQEIAAGRVT
eukprot:gene34750-40817_t